VLQVISYHCSPVSRVACQQPDYEASGQVVAVVVLVFTTLLCTPGACTCAQRSHGDTWSSRLCCTLLCYSWGQPGRKASLAGLQLLHVFVWPRITVLCNWCMTSVMLW
jgi:hypothetical protein